MNDGHKRALLYGLATIPAIVGAALDWNMWVTFAVMLALAGAGRVTLHILRRDIEPRPERRFQWLTTGVLYAVGIGFCLPSLDHRYFGLLIVAIWLASDGVERFLPLRRPSPPATAPDAA